MAKITIDSFIEQSSHLFEVYPGSASLSITYSNVSKKLSITKKASNAVTFKCYEPNLGKLVKYKTSKIKELSKLLTYAGPRGVLKQKDDKKDQEIGVKATGVATIMSNSPYVEIKAVSQTPEPEQPKKSKKKKKGKK